MDEEKTTAGPPKTAVDGSGITLDMIDQMIDDVLVKQPPGLTYKVTTALRITPERFKEILRMFAKRYTINLGSEFMTDLDLMKALVEDKRFTDLEKMYLYGRALASYFIV